MKKLIISSLTISTLLIGSPIFAQNTQPEGVEASTSASATDAPRTDDPTRVPPSRTTSTRGPGKEVVTVVEEPAFASRISGDAGFSILNQYNTRGIIVQDHGAIFQPYLNIYLKVYEGDGFINKITLQAGLWADLSTDNRVSDPTKGSFSRHFTELDFITGASIQFAERFNFTVLYDHWITPANGYREGQWIQGILGFDDSNLLFPNFSIQPLFKALYELPGESFSGLAPKAWYLEPSLTPNYTFLSETDYPINFGVNFTWGLGGEFYAGEVLGYFALGPQVSVPLAFIPQDFGQWTASAGYRHYFLGDNTAAIAPGGDHNQDLYSFSIGVKF